MSVGGGPGPPTVPLDDDCSELATNSSRSALGVRASGSAGLPVVVSLLFGE